MNNYKCSDCDSATFGEMVAQYKFHLIGLVLVYLVAGIIFRKNYIIVNDLISDLSKTIEYKNQFETIF